jgi:hypothetical protein
MTRTVHSDGKNPGGLRPPFSRATSHGFDVGEAFATPASLVRDFRGHDGAEAAGPGGGALPREVAHELASLLAEALVADLRAFPNLAANKATAEATVSSPWGHDRGSPPSALALACRGP